MVRITSLKRSIILQFVAIITPFALVLLYQVLFDLKRIDTVRFEQGTAALAREARDNYKQFLNRVADAVDTGSLSGSSLPQLAKVSQGLADLRRLELRHHEHAPDVELALSRLNHLLPQVRRNLPVDALRPHLPLIQEINGRLAALVEKMEQRALSGNREFAKNTERQVRLMLTTLGLTLAIAAFFIFRLIRGLTRPLGYAIELARNISEGNLQASASSYSRGDLQGLIGSIEAMRAALQKLFVDLENKEVRLANAQRIAGIGDWEIDLASGAVIWSREFYAILGYPPHESAAASGIPLERVHAEERSMVEQALADARQAGTNIDTDFRMMMHSGAVRHLHLQAEVAMLDGVPLKIMGTLQDVTYRKISEEKLRYLAMHDGLTGLPNRLMFKQQLDRGIEIAHRAGGSLAVLFLDLDHFKHINDSLGHHLGDELLKEVGKRIVASLRTSDYMYSPESSLIESVVSRLGGDEFTVLLNMVKSDQVAAVVAQRIIEDLNAPFSIGENQLFVSTSIGISLYPRDGADGVSLLKNADCAMYFAKQEGRNHYQFFTESMNDQALGRLHMETDLHKALRDGEFVLYYQPKVYIESRKMYGVEALIRWNHPEKGMISPSEFIPLAEARGLIVAIGEWVVDTACRQAAAWHKAGYGKLSVAINLAAPSFKSRHLGKAIADACAVSGVDPTTIELEVTESVMMGGLATVLPTLHALKSMGLKLALDDFGTGYSSLSYLGRFPLDTLKIDRSFVTKLDQAEGAAIVRAIIALSKSLKLSVIAEGVETEDEAAFLLTHGCDRMQGYLFSRPVPAQAISELLRDHYFENEGWQLDADSALKTS